ncbi:MAG: putative quinol monooxygenase [Actinomycetes bacterium]
MFGLVVRFDIAAGQEAAFDRLTDETVDLVRSREPGTLVYACHAVSEEPSARVFYELYRDRDAFEAHEAQDHVRRFLEEREQFLIGPPRVEFLALQTGKGVPVPSER